MENWVEERKINTAEYIKTIKESPEKRRSYAFFGFSILVIIALIVFAIRPTVTTIAKINKEIKEKERINSLLEKKVETLNELDKQYTPNREAFDDLEMIFPPGENFPLLLANIELVTTRNGHELSSVSFDRYKGRNYKLGTKILTPYTMTFSAQGREENILSFLKELEDLPMFPVIESFSYSTERADDGRSGFSVSLRIYHVENVNFYK
jgi:Tfp pilus assembly protein PilO